MAAVPLSWGPAGEAVAAVGRALPARCPQPLAAPAAASAGGRREAACPAGPFPRRGRAAAARPLFQSLAVPLRLPGALLAACGRCCGERRTRAPARTSADAFTLGLLEREIDHVLQQLHQAQTQNPEETLFSQTLHQENDRCIDQKEIDEEDVCPFCQEELLKEMLPITYRRYSCGNNVHIKGMKIWADHQDELENDSVVKCSLCREKFAPLRLILEFRNSKLVTATEKTRLDRHLGIPCNNCRVFPIVGKCYDKCTECVEYHLCHECFTGFCHSHVFIFRQKRNKKRALQQLSELSAQGGTFKSFNPGNNSKEELLYLQEKLNEHTSLFFWEVCVSVHDCHISKHSNLLALGIQCRLCLKSFQLGHVRLLPCNYKFHRERIDSCLLQQRNTCPIDEYVVYNPLTRKDTPAKHGNFPTGWEFMQILANLQSKWNHKSVYLEMDYFSSKYHLNTHQK
ncbi:LOW QUALITY PROTEIN: E3 ubiquitin-protein ligase ZSWIM2 [Sarcoramphus papa]